MEILTFVWMFQHKQYFKKYTNIKKPFWVKHFQKVVAKQYHFHTVAGKQPGNNTPALVFSHILSTQATKTCSESTTEKLEKGVEIFSKLTIKTPEQRHSRNSCVFIVNFDHISHLVLVFFLLPPASMYLFAWTLLFLH